MDTRSNKSYKASDLSAEDLAALDDLHADIEEEHRGSNFLTDCPPPPSTIGGLNTPPAAPTHVPNDKELIETIDGILETYLWELYNEYTKPFLAKENWHDIRSKATPTYGQAGIDWGLYSQPTPFAVANAAYTPKKIFQIEPDLMPGDYFREKELFAKFNYVQEIRAVLANPHQLAKDRLQALKHMLDGRWGQSIAQHRSSNNLHAVFRDAQWKRVVATILACLIVPVGVGLAIRSRFFTPKKSWDFTKTRGETVINEVNNSLKNRK